MFDGTLQSVRANHRQDLIRMLVFPCPCVADDVAPGRTADPLTDTEDRVDVGLEVPPSVPPEDEFVGVDVDVLVSHAMVRPVGPSLEVREEAMNPGEDLMGWWSIHRAEVDREVTAIRQAPVGGVSVGQQDAANCGVVPDEGVQTFSVDVDDPLQATPHRVLPFPNLDRADHENLPDRASALATAFWFALAPEGDARLVDLDDAAEWGPFGCNHGSPELLEKKPSGLVTS
jgi:hypothetical protein